jgi:hypothetical protein
VLALHPAKTVHLATSAFVIRTASERTIPIATEEALAGADVGRLLGHESHRRDQAGVAIRRALPRFVQGSSV